MGVQSEIVYVDYAKAFYVVGHEKLPLKLEKYGVVGCFLKWIRIFRIWTKF